MGVLNGQPVDQSVTNSSFINKNNDDAMPNKLGFTRAISGPSIADIQAAVNKLYTATGASESNTGTDYVAPADTIDVGDSYQTALSKLAQKFAAATGHTHDGTDGEGPLLNVVRSLAASGSSPLVGDVLMAGINGVGISQIGNTLYLSATGNVNTISASGNPGISGSVILQGGDGVQLSQAGQVITIAATGAGGGGGGGSLQWIEGVNSPIPIFEYGIESYAYSQGLAQEIYTTIKVPNSYSSGSPINLGSLFYSDSATGNVLLQASTALIRPNVDALSSYSFGYTSTNSAVSLTGSTINKPQSLSLDLTNGSGQIGGVSVSPGDLIIAKLLRGTDTATGDAKAILFGSEVSFS